MKIVCLGDSTTAGTPLFKSPVESPPAGEGDERSQFPYWLRHTHPNWQVLNCGVNGERTDQIAARFDRDVIAHNPDLVVLIAGVNDVYQGRGADEVTRQLKEMYERARAAALPLVAGSIVPYNTATGEQNQRMRSVNDWIRRETRRGHGLWFVDTRAAAAAPDDADRLAGSPDGLHPDIDGYRRMADALAPVIERALRR
jgi:lysophospholipase L1-like esterase